MQSRIPLCNISYFMVSFGNVEVKKKKKSKEVKNVTLQLEAAVGAVSLLWC